MDISTLGLQIDSRSTRAAARDLDGFTRSSDRAGDAAEGVEGASRGAGRSMRVMAGAAAAAAAAVATLTASFGAAQRYTQMSNSLRSLGFSSEDAARALEDVAGVATRTRAPLEATAQLYQRITIAGRDLGASQDDVLRFTENVGLALAQTGGSAGAASGALLQLSQAMAGGVVRAEEFNSILEGAFPIAQAAANAIEGAAGSVGQLRQMVIAGEVSSREFFDAILSQSDALEDAFANTVPTVSGAIGNLTTSFTMMIGEIDAATGASEALARGIMFVADNMDVAASAIVVAAQALTVSIVGLAATQLPALAASAIAAARGFSILSASMAASRVAAIATTRAMVGLRAAMVFLGGPWGVLAGLVAAAASYFLLFRDNGREAENSAYDMAAATAALNGELRVFSETASPAAAASAIELANSNYEGANAAFEHARGLLAMQRAALEASRADYSNITDPESGLILGERMAEAQRQYNEQIQIVAQAERSLEQAQNDRARAARTVTGSTVTMTAAVDASATAIETVSRGAGSASRSVDEMTESADEAADTFDGPLSSAMDSVANAFDDFVSRGFSDFKGFLSDVVDSFKSMIGELVATAARNRIMIALGISGGAATPAMAGGGGNILSGLLGGGGGIGALFNGLAGSGGFGGVLGGVGQGLAGVLGGGGLGSSFANLGGFLNGSVGGAGAFGAAIPAVGLLLGGLGLAKSFFGSKTTATGLTGAQGTIDDMGGGSLREWTEFKTKRRGKSRWSLQYSASAMAEPFFESAAAIQSSIRDMAEDLGVGASAFEGFSHSFNLTFNNFTADQKAKALEAELERMGDRFAALIPNISSLNELVAVTSERYQLETRLLQLQGNTDALRARELDTVHELNREMLIQIYQMEDLNAVLSKLNENDFATRLDFIRAQAHVRAGILGSDYIDAPSTSIGTSQGYTSVGVSPKVGGTNSAMIGELRALRSEVEEMRKESAMQQAMIASNTKGTKDVLRGWDNNGLPAEETA